MGVYRLISSSSFSLTRYAENQEALVLPSYPAATALHRRRKATGGTLTQIHTRLSFSPHASTRFMGIERETSGANERR